MLCLQINWRDETLVREHQKGKQKKMIFCDVEMIKWRDVKNKFILKNFEFKLKN